MLWTPFPRLSYAEALARYGSDKPDLRFDLPLVDLTEVAGQTDFRIFREVAATGGAIRGLRAPGCAGYSRKQIQDLTDLAIKAGAKGLVGIVRGAGEVTSAIGLVVGAGVQAIMAALGLEVGDLGLIVADQAGRPAWPWGVAQRVGPAAHEPGERGPLGA